MQNRIPHFSLFEKRIPRWLLAATQGERNELERLTLAAHRSAERLRLLMQPIPDVRSFALARLRPALARLAGTEIDAETVRIERTWRPLCIPPSPPLNPTEFIFDTIRQFCPLETTDQPLLYAALANYPSTLGYGVHEESFQITGASQVDPAGFVAMAFDLDIGSHYREELISHLPPPAASPSGVETAFVAWQRDQRAMVAQEAVLQGHVSRELADLWREGELGSDASDVRLFDHVLNGGRCYRPNQGAVLLFLPNSPAGALRAFADEQAMHDHLLALLRSKPQRASLVRMALLKEQAELASQLSANLGAAPGSLPAGGNTAGQLAVIQFNTLADDSDRAGYQRWRDSLLLNAATVAVPATDLAQQQRERDIAALVDRCEQTLITVAMLIPGCQPLGWAALAVFVYGVADQLYDGYHAWQLGDREAAIHQFFNIAANLAAGAMVNRVQGRLLSGLQVGQNDEGETRLWRHDTALWKPVSLPGSLARLRSPFRQGGYRWIRLEEATDEQVAVNEADDAVALRVPGNHSGIVPVLVPIGEQKWQWLHDSPQGREGISLLRCFPDLPAYAEDQDMLEAWRLSGTSSAKLRWLASHGKPLPGALRFWLRTRHVRREVLNFTALLGVGTAVDVPHPELVRTLAELPGWPQDLALEYLDPDGPVYLGPEEMSPGLSLTPQDFSSGRWAERVLASMSMADRATASGSSVPQQQAVSLSQRWGAHIRRYLPTLMPRLLRQGTLEEAGFTLLRVFPGLPEEVIQEVVDAADSHQYSELFHGKVPMELSLAALDAGRQMRMARALEGLDLGEPSDDADRLFMANLARITSWPAGTRIRLSSDTFAPQPLGDVGAAEAAALEILRSGTAYRRRLAGRLGEAGTLEQVIYDSLAGDDRRVLFGDLPALSLRQRVSAKAWEDFARVRNDLGIRPSEDATVQLPRSINGRIGYPLSGRPLGGRTFSWRLRRLFPGLSDEAVKALQVSLQAETGRRLIELVPRLEEQFSTLSVTLAAWQTSPVPEYLDVPVDRMVAVRRQVCDLIKACWRRETSSLGAEGGQPMYSLDLTYREVGELPHLGDGFEHMQILRLGAMKLSLTGPDFLASFPNVRELHLNDNPIVRLPVSVGRMTSLRRLNLANTALLADPAMFDPLLPPAQPPGAARPLRALMLSGVPDVNAEALGKLEQLTELESLFWSNAAKVNDDHLAAVSRLSTLRMLVLNYSHITLTRRSQGFLTALTKLQWVDLGRNRLTLAPQVTGLFELARLILQGGQLSALPEGLIELAGREPLRLTWLDLSENRLQHIEPFIQVLQTLENRTPSMYVRLDDNPIQGGQLNQLESLGLYVRHSADSWLPPLPPLRQAVRLARGNTRNAAFLDWVSAQVYERFDRAPGWANFLARVFDVTGEFNRFREVIQDFDARLGTLRMRLFNEIHNYWKPKLSGLNRQVEAFSAAQQIALASPDDRYDALLQHNYRQWQKALSSCFPPAQVAELTQRDRFVTWLLNYQSDLDQNEVQPPLGEQDWRPYLDLIDPRWSAAQTRWEEAQGWLEDALDAPQDSARLPLELVDQMIAPSEELPRAFAGLGAPQDVIEPVNDVAWRVGGVPQPVQLNEDQYRRASQVYRRARVMVQERLAREITEGVVQPWWEPVQE